MAQRVDELSSRVKPAVVAGRILSYVFSVSPKRGTVVAVLISLAVSLFFMWCAHLEQEDSRWVQFFKRMELYSLDLRFRVRGEIKPGNDVVIVALDEETLAREKSYPLPRSRYGQLVERMVEGGAKVVAFDVMFVEPQNREILERIDGKIQEYKKSHPNAPKDDPVLQALAEEREAFDEDTKLAASFRRALEKGVCVVTAIHFLTAEEAEREGIPGQKMTEDSYRMLVGSAYLVRTPVRPKEDPWYKICPPRHAVAALNVVYPLAEASAGIGFADYALDHDGVVRCEYLVTEFNGEYYAPLGLQALFWYLNLDSKELALRLWEGVKIGKIEIPIDLKGRMRINFRGDTNTFPTYSLSKVISGEVPPATFKDKLVLVGATAKGTGDFVVTPFSGRLPGVVKHANVIDSILQQGFIRHDDRTVLKDQVIVLFLGLIVGLALSFLTAASGLCFAVLLSASMMWYTYYEFAYQHLWHNVTYPLLTIFLSFCLVTGYRFATETRRKREVKQVFERYMQASVVTEVLRHMEDIQLGGDVREITVFFSDLAGFSTISEMLTPQAVITFLNQCYDEMAPAILQRNAFLDKFWGDAIVAAFGVPIQQKDDATQACLAALDCQERLARLNEKLTKEGRPLALARIGLHSGPAVVGNVGSRQAKRFNYTALGDAVNVGARLESANKDFQTNILISSATYNLAQYAVEARELGRILVKGRKEAVPVYELLGEMNKTPGRKLVLSDIFHHGLQLYLKRDWDGASFAFQKALAHSPNDGPSLVYLRACKAFRETPPPDNWDGILVMKEGKD